MQNEVFGYIITFTIVHDLKQEGVLQNDYYHVLLWIQFVKRGEKIM
jgi:hypothetical protein